MKKLLLVALVLTGLSGCANVSDNKPQAAAKGPPQPTPAKRWAANMAQGIGRFS